jgi:short-subunit dehydrogenase
LCDALRARGTEVVATDVRGAEVALDVTDAEACRALASSVRPSIWINNAGILGAAAAVDQSDDEIARVVQVNLLGVINGSRAAAQSMRSEGGGHILNVGSMASWVSPAGLAVYGATKHAVRAYSVALAAELEGTGVHVQVICPDGIWTPMLHDKVRDQTSAMSFIAGTLLEPDAVAAAAMELLDSERLVRSIPRNVGFTARVLCIAPSLNIRLTPLMRRLGAKGQKKMERRAAEAR